MDKPEFLKQFWDVLEQDAMVMSFYNHSDWEKIIDAFFDYTPLFADNVFEGVSAFDQVGRDDNISDLISEITSPDAGIDLTQSPPFSTAYFSQYLTLPESLERPLGQPQAPLLKPKLKVTPKTDIEVKTSPQPEHKPKPKPQDVESSTIKVAIEPKPETVGEKESKSNGLSMDQESSNQIPEVKSEPVVKTIVQPDVTTAVEELSDKVSETYLEDNFDKLNVPTQSTTEFLARKEANEETQIAKSFGDFEVLYRNQMLSIMSSHDEMSAMRISLYGVNLTEFKLDEINPDVRMALVDGLLNRYDSRIDSGEFDPREYLAWSDLDAGYVDNPSTFPGLIERDLKEIMQVIYDDLT